MSTQKKLAELTEIIVWHYKRSNEIRITEDRTGEYLYNEPARLAFADEYEAKLEAAGIDQEIHDLYEERQYGEADARATRWEDAQR